MHVFVLSVAKTAIAICLLAANYYFWELVWDHSAGPASRTHPPMGK